MNYVFWSQCIYCKKRYLILMQLSCMIHFKVVLFFQVTLKKGHVFLLLLLSYKLIAVACVSSIVWIKVS